MSTVAIYFDKFEAEIGINYGDIIIDSTLVGERSNGIYVNISVGIMEEVLSITDPLRGSYGTIVREVTKKIKDPISFYMPFIKSKYGFNLIIELDATAHKELLRNITCGRDIMTNSRNIWYDTRCGKYFMDMPNSPDLYRDSAATELNADTPSIYLSSACTITEDPMVAKERELKQKFYSRYDNEMLLHIKRGDRLNICNAPVNPKDTTEFWHANVEVKKIITEKGIVTSVTVDDNGTPIHFKKEIDANIKYGPFKGVPIWTAMNETLKKRRMLNLCAYETYSIILK